MRLLWPILFLCISFLALSLHILRRHVRLPLVTLLYTYLLLVTYSVHMKIFDSLLIHPHFDLNLWPRFYSREFYGLFWYFYILYGYKCTCIWWSSLADLFFTNGTFSWLIILYSYLFSLSTPSYGPSLYTSDFNGLGPAVRVFANGPGDLGSIPGRVIPKTLKMELDTTLLNTQHYKVRFKGKVEQSWEWSSALPYTLV